jgi:hypothetical protein
MLADIASGETDVADAFFLIALILAIIAALAYASRRTDALPWAPVLLSLAFASAAFAWLVL